MTRMEAPDTGSHLRLIWPQWQGAAANAYTTYAPEFPLEIARRGYAVGATVLSAVLPAHTGPTAVVPVAKDDPDISETRDGIESKSTLLQQLRTALDIIRAHSARRITTLGGECSVSVAPFAALAERYEGDLAILWIDSHPDLGTGRSQYPGYHAMALSTIIGRGDLDIVATLPATVPAEHVALVGVHSWTPDDFPHIADWGITAFSPSSLAVSTQPVVEWIAETKCSHVAIHFDVDVIDGKEALLGMAAEEGGLTKAQLRRILADVANATDVVALTIAEFIPRQVMHLMETLELAPLMADTPPAGAHQPIPAPQEHR